MIEVKGPRLLVKPDVAKIDPVYAAARAAGLALKKTNDEIREEQAVTFGTVIGIGDLCWQAPVGDGTPWCKEGDYVIYAKHAGRFIEDPFNPVKDELYLLLNDEDVLGIVSKGDANG